MDLIDSLRELSGRVSSHHDILATEEATKNALVMPFLTALGFDVFNPREVVPEYTADVGTKKGEKVDYALKINGKLVILIECKTIGCNLDSVTPSQLYRYFTVTDARFGVLTNGIAYRFFSDLESPNRMDERPFFEFDMRDVNDRSVAELKKFSKSQFDLDDILATASDLKYTKGIKRSLAEEWTNPSEEFVRLFTTRVYDGRFTQTIRDQFAQITRRALHEFVGDRVNERLKAAIEKVERREEPDEEAAADNDRTEDIETTQEEIEGFYIVRSIVSEIVNPKRVFMRDTRSYCGVLLDDNNRKPICRLLFNSPRNKYLGLFDAAKYMSRHPLSQVTDIYQFADQIRETVARYDSGSS